MPQEPSEPAKCSVTGALSTLYRMAQIISFGSAPIQLKRKRDGHQLCVSPNADRIKYLVILVILTINLNMLRNEAPKHHVTWQCLTVNLILATVFAIYGAPDRLRSVIRALNILQKINDSIGYENNLLFEKKKSIAIVVSIIYLTCLVLLNPWTLTSGQKSSITFDDCCFTFFLYQYVLMHLLSVEFAICAIEVASTLRSINDLLEYILRTNFEGIESVSKVKRPKTMAETIHHLAVQYNEACQAVGLLDESSGPVVLITLVICFIHLVWVPYIIIIAATDHIYLTWTYPWMVQWAIIHFCWLLLLLEPCHKIQEEVDRATLTTSKLLTMCQDELISKELNKMSLNLLLNNVTYSPLGICVLSRDLLNAMLVSITTFLIIVVQFQKL